MKLQRGRRMGFRLFKSKMMPEAERRAIDIGALQRAINAVLWIESSFAEHRSAIERNARQSRRAKQKIASTHHK